MTLKIKIVPILILTFLLGYFNTYCQSFFIKHDGKLIECTKIINKNNVFQYRPVDSPEKESKIEKDSIRAYYQDEQNTYYEDKNGFKELIIEGDIKIYCGEVSTAVVRTTGVILDNWQNQYTKWYIEKDGVIFHAFNQQHGTIGFNNLKKEKINHLILDDSIASKKFAELKKNAKLKELLGIFQSYNAGQYLKRAELNQPKVKEEESTIIVFRDSGKEYKGPLEFSINGQKYFLERNTKLEVSVPNSIESIICFSNDYNNTRSILSSSPLYPKFYQLKLDKEKNGSIEKVNGNSSYYKTRFEYYEKRAPKSRESH